MLQHIAMDCSLTMGSSAVLPRITEKPVVWGDGDGSPEMPWGNAKKDQEKKLDSPKMMESKKAALEAFYEQMAKSTDVDLTLKDLVQPSATTRFDDDVDVVARIMETVLERESEVERSSADQPGKPGLRVGDVLGKENLRPKKKNFTAPTAKSSRSQTTSARRSCAAARSQTAPPPNTSLTKSTSPTSQKRRTSGGKAIPRTTFPRTPPNPREVAHNFQCKYCFLCGTRPYFFKTRCLVCGKLYCAKCVKKAMGNMLEGPKCVKCLGVRFSETCYMDRLASAKGCISVPLFRADHKDLICIKE